jgi:tetratricopeptide (TPR) repeat protein
MIAVLAALMVLAQKTPPPSPLEGDRLIASGQSKYQKGDYTGAMADFNKVLQLDPRSAKALSNRGMCQAGLKQYDKALVDYAKAIDIDPRHTYAFVGRGDICLARRQFEDAITSYAKAIETNPSHASAHVFRGIAWSEKDEYTQAYADFERAVRLLSDAKDGPALFQRGAAKHWTHDFAGAAADFTKSLEFAPRNATTLWYRARTRLFLGKLPEAESDAKGATAMDAKDGGGWITLGDVYYFQGAWADAVKTYQMACKLDPGVEDAARLRAFRAQLHAGDKDAAVADLTEFIKKRKPPLEDRSFRRASDYLLGKTPEEIFLGGLDGDDRRILEIRCDSYSDAGLKRLMAGDGATAKTYFQRAVETRVKDRISYAVAAAELAEKK